MKIYPFTTRKCKVCSRRFEAYGSQTNCEYHAYGRHRKKPRPCICRTLKKPRDFDNYIANTTKDLASEIFWNVIGNETGTFLSDESPESQENIRAIVSEAEQHGQEKVFAIMDMKISGFSRDEWNELKTEIRRQAAIREKPRPNDGGKE